MAKRSHSESILEEASKLLENGSSSKKQRVDKSHSTVNDSVGAGKKSKDGKKDKTRYKSKREGLIASNGDSHEGSADAPVQVQHPDGVRSGSGEASGAQVFDEARKKERRRKRKEREALAKSSENGLGNSFPEVSMIQEKRAGTDPLGVDDAVRAASTTSKRFKGDATEKKRKKERRKEDVEADQNDSVALSGELAQDIPQGVPTLKSNSLPPASKVAAAALSQLYEQDASLTNMSKNQIDSFLASNFITISDPLSAGYRPITDFAFLPAGTDAQHEIFKAFPSPTPIQAAAWPFLFAGRDVVGIAETGSGKTIAFGLPCMRFVASHATNSKKGRSRVKAVVVSPTRELALQIYEQFTKLAAGSNIKVVCIYGGVPKDEQRTALKSASIIVATPGRLNDFLQEGAADLSNVGYVVLDEADRMLDKGFEDEIRKIISTIPTSTCQTAMFTATWPQSIRELAATFMKDPVKIAIGDNPSGDLRANARVTQLVEVVDPRGKEMRLLQLLKQYQSGKNKDDRILVFCLYKKEATRIENFIHSKGFRVAGIHGDLNQSARTASLEAFKSGKVPILVATDVAARGLDIPSVKLVINVTFPLTAEDYVHRIGRTGRAGKDGLAITLFTEHDKAQSGPLINVLKAAKQDVPEELLKFGTTVKKKAHDAYGAFYKDAGEDPKKATKITFD